MTDRSTLSEREALFAPVTIQALALRNRFVMAPMTRTRSPGGVPDENVAQYYQRRAAGEVGLLITEGIGIDHPAALGGPSGANGEMRVPDLHGPALAGWRRVVELVHDAGGAIVAQLWHQGVNRESGTGPHPEAEPTRPSGIWGPANGKVSMAPDAVARLLPETRPLTDDEIVELIDAYARSARSAMDAGFDGVEIHGAHGYLPDAFFWEITNRRTDRWGGDPARRAFFAAEVVRATRRVVGERYPIFFRFSQWKIQDYGASIAATAGELEALLGPVADAGVDVFDASQRLFVTPAFPGSELNLAGWAKKLTGKPAMTVGGVGLSNGMYDSKIEGKALGVDNLDRAAAMVAAGDVDLVGVGRALLGDAQWIAKAKQGAPFETFLESSKAVLQ
jgi:2,4-dienoyl-CoA reductase-like NADH-dependent reductase (Old Yellow Enzyme family)